jgi:sporulation-control protein spo0M
MSNNQKEYRQLWRELESVDVRAPDALQKVADITTRLDQLRKALEAAE